MGIRPQTGSETGTAGRLGAVKAEGPGLRPQHHLKKKKKEASNLSAEGWDQGTPGLGDQKMGKLQVQ